MTLTASPLDAVIAALRNHGCNPRQSRDGQWNSRCPNQAAHARGDRNPSLSIGVGLGDRALVHCQTGCPPEVVAEALGLRLPDLFPPPAVNGNGSRKRVVDRYDYVDTSGKLVFQVERMDPKGFRQRRPIGNDWAYNLDGVLQPPLYRADRIALAVLTGEDIWVVEGEKDVHALERAGLVATTCPMGAEKWRSWHTDALAGAGDVRVVADDDAKGHAHAQAVEAALSAVVGHVRLYLPKQGHKDIAEHLGAGYGIDELRPWPDDTPPSLFIDWAEFWAKDHKTEEWLAWPLIPKGRQVALYAPPKTGKSIVTLAAVAALATGRSVFGQPPQPPIHVLYLDYEMTEDDLYERLEALGYGPADDLSHLHYALLPALPPLDTQAGADTVCDLADQTDAMAIVVDTMGRAVQGDENDSTPYREFARLTGIRLKKAGRALLRTDHAGKNRDKGQRGSSAKADDVDLVYRLDVNDSGYTLTRTHTRISWAPDKTVITRTGGNGEYVQFVATRKARTFVPGTKEAADLLNSLGIPTSYGRDKVRKALADKGADPMPSRLLEDAIRHRKQQTDDVDGFV